jgi:hypothetical protein
MLEIIVRLEEGIAGEELDQDAADAPNIAGVRPPETKDDLGCPVMTSRDDGRVVFILEGCRAEINQPNLGVQQHLSLAGLPIVVVGGGGRDLAVVCEGLVLVVAQQDVFRLQIRVDQVEVM